MKLKKKRLHTAPVAKSNSPEPPISQSDSQRPYLLLIQEDILTVAANLKKTLACATSDWVGVEGVNNTLGLLDSWIMPQKLYGVILWGVWYSPHLVPINFTRLGEN